MSYVNTMTYSKYGCIDVNCIVNCFCAASVICMIVNRLRENDGNMRYVEFGVALWGHRNKD